MPPWESLHALRTVASSPNRYLSSVVSNRPHDVQGSQDRGDHRLGLKRAPGRFTNCETIHLLRRADRFQVGRQRDLVGIAPHTQTARLVRHGVTGLIVERLPQPHMAVGRVRGPDPVFVTAGPAWRDAGSSKGLVLVAKYRHACPQRTSGWSFLLWAGLCLGSQGPGAVPCPYPPVRRRAKGHQTPRG